MISGRLIQGIFRFFFSPESRWLSYPFYLSFLVLISRLINIQLARCGVAIRPPFLAILPVFYETIPIFMWRAPSGVAPFMTFLCYSC